LDFWTETQASFKAASRRADFVVSGGTQEKELCDPCQRGQFLMGVGSQAEA
jgi:hypothetical protein